MSSPTASHRQGNLPWPARADPGAATRRPGARVTAATESGGGRVGWGRHLALGSGWFGLNFHWLPIGFVLIQSQIRGLVPRDVEALAIGAAVGAGGILAVLVPPLTGLWSDRLRTRWGRRRPVIAVGLAGDVAGLALMATATTYAQLVVGYAVIQLFANAAGAAYAGIVPDRIPRGEVGVASGVLAALNNLGGILGVGAAFILASLNQIALSYAVIAVVVVLSFVPVLIAATERATAARPATPGLLQLLRPLAGSDFAWVVFTRLLITAAVTVVAYFLSPFFRDVVHVANTDQFTALWLLIVFAAAVPVGLLGGRWSDRWGRKPFVYGSGAFQGLVAVVFVIFYPTSVPLVIALGAVYGLGYGLYYAVDWALACDTLPDDGAAAGQMGVFHIAYTLPQVIVPLIGGALITAMNAAAPGNGYRIVFGLSIVFFLLGTVFVYRVRTAR
jgi:MFS family permease